MNPYPTPRSVVDVRCELAENPLWDAELGALYWTDIPLGKIYSWKPASRVLAEAYTGEMVGGFTVQANGDLLLFRTTDIAWLRPGGRVYASRRVVIDGAQRFNDVQAGPDGSVFAGTIGRTPTSGGLYHFSPDGAVGKLFDGTGCSNGMGFSPDDKTFYWTCSTTRKIFAFDFSDGRVAVDSRRVFYAAPEGEGIPDGMTVDARGHIWSARWDGARLVEIAPDGKKLGEIAFPRARVSSICIGGEALDRGYVSIAETEGEPEAGLLKSIFELEGLSSGGRAEFRSRLTPDHLTPVELP